MPNWVSNSIYITSNSNDPKVELQKFLDHIASTPDLAGEDNQHFSFHSFVTTKMTKEEYDNAWYDWNYENWDTKWDAHEAVIGSDSTSISLNFETAWSPPEKVTVAMASMFPDLTFEVWWEEEQGFGGKYTLHGETYTNYDSWDIPESHADYVARDREDSCMCACEGDSEYWFDDCPGKQKTTYIVEVVTKYYVEARSSEDAVKAAEAEESGYDLPADTTVSNIEYADEYRCVGAKVLVRN